MEKIKKLEDANFVGGMLRFLCRKKVINIENNVIIIKEISDFTYKGENIELTEPFKINISESSFIIRDLPENTNWTCNDGSMIEKKCFLYCKDINGNLITLLDCEIKPLNIFASSFFIVWDKMIFGCHIESEDLLEVSILECSINDKKLPCHCFIGKENYKIENNEIEVNTDWNIIDGDSGKRILGSNFWLKSEKAIAFSRLYKVFQNLMCVYYFYIGFFPSEVQIKSEYKGTEILVYSPNRSIYNTSNKYKDFNVSIGYNKENLSEQYEKWIELYKKNEYVFHLFFNAQYNEDAFSEVITFSFIQCLESFYSSFNDIQKFSDDQKKEILKELKTQVKQDEKIKKILMEIDQYTIDDLQSSLDGMLDRLNILSLNKIIGNILDSVEGQIVFEYEHSQKGILQKTKSKLYNHRNFIAHINDDNDYFRGDENILIQNKLMLLFRAFVLGKLGSEYGKENLKKISKYIENRYRN